MRRPSGPSSLSTRGSGCSRDGAVTTWHRTRTPHVVRSWHLGKRRHMLVAFVVTCRYDMMDFVHHIYSDIKRDGYRGVNISALYRDEVRVRSSMLLRL